MNYQPQLIDYQPQIGLLGTSAFNYNVTGTIPIGSSQKLQLLNPGYAVLVNFISIALIGDGIDIPIGVATDLENITIQISDNGSNANYAKNPLTSTQLHYWGKSDRFVPFVLMSNSSYDIDVVHTPPSAGSKYKVSLLINIGFHGSKYLGDINNLVNS